MDVAERCQRVLGRLPPGVVVVAAAKGRTPEEIRAAVEAGIRHVGENYVQEAAAKRKLLPPGVTLHLIGRLQGNKAGKAASLFDWVQTVDSLGLARKLSAAAVQAGKDLPVLVQVNVGREPQKGGALPEDVPALAKAIQGLPGLRLRGLMALPPEPEDPEDSRPHFRALRRLFDALRSEGYPLDTLSMGMSADWEVALEEGATMIRLGTLLFGPRSAPP